MLKLINIQICYGLLRMNLSWLIEVGREVVEVHAVALILRKNSRVSSGNKKLKQLLDMEKLLV